MPLGPQLHVAHEFASAFQQARGIGQLGAAKEPDVDVGLEGIDVGKRCVTYATGRLAIVQQLSNVIATAADDFEPLPCDGAQFA